MIEVELAAEDCQQFMLPLRITSFSVSVCVYRWIMSVCMKCRSLCSQRIGSQWDWPSVSIITSGGHQCQSSEPTEWVNASEPLLRLLWTMMTIWVCLSVSTWSDCSLNELLLENGAPSVMIPVHWLGGGGAKCTSHSLLSEYNSLWTWRASCRYMESQL